MINPMEHSSSQAYGEQQVRLEVFGKHAPSGLVSSDAFLLLVIVIRLAASKPSKGPGSASIQP
jgi:hypothetical protein